MTDLLNFISKGHSKFELAQSAILSDDVLQLQDILENSDITQNTTILNSPNENLLTVRLIFFNL